MATDERDIDANVATVAEIMGQGHQSAEDQLKAAGAIVNLVAGFLTDVRRVADAVEQLAQPPAEIVTSVDADEWAAKEAARTALDERHVSALERLADLVDQVVQTNRMFAQG